MVIARALAEAMVANALLAERAEWVTGRRDGRPDRDSADSTVLVVLRSLDLADLVHGARRFAAALDPDDADAWRRSWTRTRFLFGNPANLADRDDRDGVRVVAPGGSTAWLGPFQDGRLPGRSRLLKPVTGALPPLPEEVEVPGDGPARLLRVAVDGLTLADYLVHLHHTLAEAVLLGRLSPHERVLLRHQPAIPWDPPHPAYARVLPGTDVRPFTWLSAA